MNHLVIGAGNLGLDLARAINIDSEYCEVKTASTGFDVRHIKAEDLEKFDTVWYCVGAGSIDEAEKNPGYAESIFKDIPKKIASLTSKQNLIFFSTDYVADEDQPGNPFRTNYPHKSMYAMIRAEAENQLEMLGRPRMAVVRVGTLYGIHKLDQTFPGKILRRKLEDKIDLPLNRVVPTSTAWLARTLLDALKNGRLVSQTGFTKHHCAPKGYTSIADWGEILLGKEKIGNRLFFDSSRPSISALGCTISDSIPEWEQLWNDFNADFFHRIPY